jgi:hypothetical protein
MQKRGKELKMDLSDNYNVVCGTVDNKDARAIYINISAWGEPTENDESINYVRIISRLSKCVKQSTFNYLDVKLNERFHPNRTIVDLDMRESGIRFGKRSFMNCEITIYQKDYEEMINEGETPEILSSIVLSAIECLDDFEHFNFYKKKK